MLKETAPHRLVLFVCTMVAAAVVPALPAVADGADGHVWVNVSHTRTDLGRCYDTNANQWSSCYVFRIYPRPGGSAGIPGTYTASGHITDSDERHITEGHGRDMSADNSCAFTSPIQFTCHTDDAPESTLKFATVHVAGTQTFCFGVHGVLRGLANLGGAVDEHAYAQGCVQGGGSGNSRADTLYPGESLLAGQRLISYNLQYTLEMQTDGNLVIYKPDRVPVWATNTYGNPGAVVTMQTDGNLVVHRFGWPLWASNSAGNPNSRLVMQDDCNLVIYRQGGTPAWASNTQYCL